MMRNLCILLLLLSAITGGAAAASVSAEEQIAVTSVTVNPDTLMRGDTGTVTVEIKNTGETGVAISRAKLYPNGIAVINDKTYDSVGIIGPGNTMSFTFTVRADTADGIYYPTFYLDLRDSGSARYSVPVMVESTGIQINVVDAPETFPADSKDTITLSVGNPRESSVNGVTVTLSGEGIRSTRTAAFLGALAQDEMKDVQFEITASQSAELNFDVSYRNGINEHHTTLTVPVEIGERAVAPDMVVNNIEIARSGSAITLTGDVTNAGLKDAYSVKVTVDDPATPTDPYPVYVVGGLEPDDFSSFEVTCNAEGVSSIPLVVEYRDQDGRTFTETVNVSLNSASQASTAGSGGQIS
ncbi:MAG: CARDB domain-containing protein, partial [Methanoculleus sp.]